MSTPDNQSPQAPCPCHSGQNYDACCEPYHAGKDIAADAATLMRSRYCAYALKDADYLMKTTHRDNHQYRKNAKVWRHEILTYCRQIQCQGLEIKDSAANADGTEATVTFEARLSQGGKAFLLKETSRFVKIGRRWVYLNGQAETVPL